MAATAITGPRTGFYHGVFLGAALWDLVLGATFFVAFVPIFNALGIPLPPNGSYVHLTAAFVFVQGVGYALVYRDMARNHDLVRLGTAYKLAYAGVAIYYVLLGQLPNTVFAWFAIVDIIWAALFVAFLRDVRG